ncbi:hypothetical protein [Pantoea sp. BAV 3049]|uniref:hypothetical protein n=1 Tax=Pantoea sp. BAV 3049 TaxID=2654188 RepID=UPI00131BC6AB|nr:hypothetical protein [Pantoea sp. BAV 3049]
MSKQNLYSNMKSADIHILTLRMAKPHLTAMLQKSLPVFRDYTDKRMQNSVLYLEAQSQEGRYVAFS